MTPGHVEVVRDCFVQLQATIVAALERLDGQSKFELERIDNPGGGYSQPCVLAEGAHFEKSAVQFTYSIGSSLPPAASERNPNLAGKSFQATAISVIVHPRNPHVPTTHMNLRFFYVNADEPVWYFGGGFDLTPYIPYLEDVLIWHRHARAACETESQYLHLKQQCDEYFYLAHRQETRGIGGIFFDDFNQDGFERSFEFVQLVATKFLAAYTDIVLRRRDTPWSDAEEEWMLVRRGRYAEFNLAIDRGTKYGMQSGRRIESVLASLPPRAKWIYGYEPRAGSKCASLLDFLQPRIDWLELVDNSVEKFR